MRSHKRDSNFSAGEQHREIFHAATVCKKLCLSLKRKTDFVHPRFVNRAGYYRVDGTTLRERCRFFQGTRRSLAMPPLMLARAHREANSGKASMG